MTGPVTFRWLGVAGSAWEIGGRILAIDPFFTRPPFRNMWYGRVPSNDRLAVALMPRCDVILVTHCHWDHVMDVPGIAQRTGAQVLGSANTCALLATCGVPKEQLHCVRTGDHLSCAGFEIEVWPAKHPPTLIDRLINRALPPDPQCPLRLFDYRMDDCFSFLIQVGGWRILSGDQPVPADVWLGSPFSVSPDDLALLGTINPRLVMPIHWDNLFRPLRRGIRPMLAPPAWDWPPLHTVDLARFAREIERLRPGARVLVPEVLRPYALSHLLGT